MDGIWKSQEYSSLEKNNKGLIIGKLKKERKEEDTLEEYALTLAFAL